MKKIINYDFSRLISLASMLGLLLISTSFYIFLLRQLAYNPAQLDGVGFTDAIEYWSAFKVWQAKGNPYDDILMHQVQSEIRNSQYAIMMWNPPWLLTLFSPILSVDNFLIYARIWALSSLLAYLAGAILLILSFARSYIKDLRLWIIILSFAPFISALSFGQIGCWLFLGTALIMIGIKNHSPTLTGSGAILISLKPHLFLVFGLCSVILMFRQKSWKLIIPFFCSPVVLAILTEHLSSGYLLESWLHTVSGATPPLVTPSPQLWVTTTIPSVIIELLSISQPALKSLILLIFLIIASAIGIKLINNQPSIASLAIILLTLPLLPFGWLYDYCILITSLIFFWPQIAGSSKAAQNIICSSLILLLSSSLLINRLEEALLPLLIFITSMLLGNHTSNQLNISDVNLQVTRKCHESSK